ncbi:MAG TPA: CPBP family intramembrane glutamic endopeptidase [Gemmatimonadales bacterium]|jgi:membrane protease YdiL (CAAX protease family)|nr:CPBP family intramembrane glutamic endopeptidase [Gemmatimonadales bacterium]
MAVWVRLAYGNLLQGLQNMIQPGAAQLIVAGVSQLLGFGFATWLIGFRILRLGRSDLRWFRPRSGAPGLVTGLALGAGAAAVALLASVLVANSHWSRDTGGIGDYLGQVFKTSLVLAPAALSEEFMFRGLPLVLVGAAIGRGTALVLVAGLIFALFHGLNPGITPLGLGNIALAGIFLGVAFYAPGGLWTAFGAHLGWNATLAALDAPVSGLPFSIPLIDYRAGDPVWLSGGHFGPEGGLLATGAITGALLIMARWARRNPL